MQANDLDAWLANLPLDRFVEIGSEKVSLNRYAGGAELAVHLSTSTTPGQFALMLQNGFPSALRFDAGLALRADEGMLMLTQWLPAAKSWMDAAEALEKILHQTDAWRTAEPRSDSGARVDTRWLDQQWMRKTRAG